MNDDRMEYGSEISDRLGQVQGKILAACERAGRKPEDVTLIAVSKMKPFAAVQAAWEAGARDFGENYVQELTEKIRMMQDDGESKIPLRWHMIGHLQKNKVKYLMGQVALIHSVDTVGLAEQIEKESSKRNIITEILLEVNVAGEESKWGFRPAEAEEAARAIQRLPHVRLRGLMTSAPYTEEGENNRLWFRQLRELAHSLREQGLIDRSENGNPEPELSMGMSCDYETAVEEGATMVRVGTDIFGARDYSNTEGKSEK